ncbi:MAG: hypothetical protein LBL83_11985 [Clostridiales bacterium]|nr:hypothetical protein [Clostridiales bacterium]
MAALKNRKADAAKAWIRLPASLFRNLSRHLEQTSGQKIEWEKMKNPQALGTSGSRVKLVDGFEPPTY